MNQHPNPGQAPDAGGDMPDMPKIVLDTNVVMDGLIFKNPVSIRIFENVSGNKLRWISSLAMRQELAHVLGRGLGPRWPDVDWSTLEARWSSLACEVSSAVTHPPARWPRCTDSDDQKFIDLALEHSACWLVSRDRAVLKTASRCRALGLLVLTPEQWVRSFSPAAAS